jgi:hypothetical protein
MNSLMPLFVVVLFILSQITAYWGPKKLLFISAISAFLAGICMGLIKGINYEDFLLGVFWGVVLLISVVSSGLSTRYWANRGKKKLDPYMKENPDSLKWFKSGK